MLRILLLNTAFAFIPPFCCWPCHRSMFRSRQAARSLWFLVRLRALHRRAGFRHHPTAVEVALRRSPALDALAVARRRLYFR